MKAGLPAAPGKKARPPPKRKGTTVVSLKPGENQTTLRHRIR